MPSVPLVHNSLLECLGPFLEGRGARKAVVAQTAALPPIPQAHGETYVAGNSVLDLFESLASELGDLEFGLKYAAFYPAGGTGALGFMLNEAKDLRTAVKASARYTSLVISGLDVSYEATEDGGQLTWRYPVAWTRPHVQFNSFIVCLLIARLRACVSANWSPHRVQVGHRAPCEIAQLRRACGPNVEFDQPFNRLTFVNAFLDQPNLHSNSRLFSTVQQLGDILLAARSSGGDFRSVVSNQIVDHLGVAPPTLASVASDLGLSARTLQRRLLGEGTTFEALASEARKLVAERTLRDTDLPLTEIAFMLGFSELSAFTRAAHRWFGKPPRELRAELRGRA